MNINRNIIASAAIQFGDMKKRCPDFLFIFRDGERGFALNGDAEDLRKICGLPLIELEIGMPIVEIDGQAIELVLRRLIAAGKRCAVCDPVGDRPADPRGPDALSIQGHEMESGECDIAGGFSSASPASPIDPPQVTPET